MRHEPALGRFRIAIVAIAAMVVVSGAGAMSSYLLIGDGIAVDRVASWPAARDDQDCWFCPDDLVSGQFRGDVAEWSGLEDEVYAGDLESADHPDAVDAAEITFPILTVLAVVATAQRLSESRPDRDESNGTRAGADPIRLCRPTPPSISANEARQSRCRHARPEIAAFRYPADRSHNAYISRSA